MKSVTWCFTPSQRNGYIIAIGENEMEAIYLLLAAVFSCTGFDIILVSDLLFFRNKIKHY